MVDRIAEESRISLPARDSKETEPSGSVSRSSQERNGGRAGLFHRAYARLTDLLEPGKQKGTITALDGVRALACLLVVGYHINLITRDTHVWWPAQHPFTAALLLAGEAGVTLFFVLSGFLLFMPYARALIVKSAWPSTRRFYLRRALRIIPAYYICLFTLILLQHREYLQVDHWQHLALFLIFFMDSSKATFQAIDGPFWTLAVEWQFYLLLPLLVLGMRAIVWRCSPKMRLPGIILCLSIIIAWGMFSQFGIEYLQRHPLLDGPGWRIASAFLLGRSGKYLQDFAIGMLASLFYVYARYADARERVKQILQRLNLWLWGIGVALLLFMALWHENAAHSNGSLWLDGVKGYYSLFGEAGFASGFGLCILALLSGGVVGLRAFSLTPLRWIGHISYSTYMWHFPILVFFMVHVGYFITTWNTWLVFGCYWLWVILAILPFSLVAFLLTERPGMRLSSKLLKS